MMKKHIRITVMVLFEIGEMVTLKHDPDQEARMVTGYQVDRLGVLYECAQGAVLTKHYEFELEEIVL